MQLRRHSTAALCILALTLTSLAGTARAQVSTASIVGKVADATGAAVSNATVTATQVETSISRTVSSGNDGLFNIPLLPLGSYTLKVSAAGFSDFQQKGIVLTVGQTANIPITLRPGNVSETVTVSANATMLNTTGSESSQLIEQHTVEGVPLNGRNPAGLLYLTGGVNNPVQNIPSTNTGSPILQNALVYPTESAATIHGVRGGGVYFSLDGANNLDPYQVTGGPFPNPDMTSEFSVVSGNYGARYVSAPGGAVNIVTKSGTNKIHGDVFEFVRNGAVNARNYFATVVDPLKRNQFGADIGAPILHDRLFVFGGYQGTRLSDIAGGNVAFVPTAQQRAGNLSNVTTPIKNPATGLPFSSNSSIGPLDPVMQKLLGYIPLPTNTATGSVTYNLPKTNTEESVVAKSDFVHGAHRIFGRYFYDTFDWPGTGIPNNNLLSTFRGQQHQWHNATVGDTWARGNNFVSDARFSFIRDNSTNVAGENSVTLPGLGAGFTNGQFPTIQLVQIIGLFNVAAGNYNGFTRNTWDGAEDITILRGRHQISFGAEVQHIDNKIVTDNEQNAIPVFTGAATGNVTADVILGYSSVTLQSDGSYIEAVGVLPGFYGEDKIRLNDRLTATAGLRWDPYWPFHALGDRISCYIPGAPQSKVFINAPSGLVFPGDPNCNSSGTNTNDLGNVQPRLGFAMKLDSSGKTVVRGGYGIYTMQFPMASFLSFGSAQPFERLVRVSTPVSVSNPWATFPGGNPFANGFQLDGKPRPANSTFINPGTAYSMAQNFKLGYIQQWSLIAERSLTDNDFLSIAYYGTVGRHLSLVQDGNQAVYIPGSSTTANVQARRPNPNVAAVNTEVSTGKSNYNGLEVVYRHRVRGGLTLSTNFDWSKSLDNASSPANVGLTSGNLIPVPNNPSFRYGPSDFDQRHTLRTMGSWNLPWYSNSTGIKKATLGGWQLNGLFTWDSGFPLSVTSSLNQSFTSNGTDLADRVPGVPISLPDNRSEQAKIAQYFNAAAFTANAPGTFGNSGRNIITSPGYVDVDTSLVKGFELGERWKVVLRVEAFNLLNHTQFLPPVGALGATLGKLTGSRDPRILQGAIKVYF
jgi:hypothetical protein